MGIGGTIGQPFWDGERIVEPEEQLDLMQLRCPRCGHIGSIDTFDCLGIDVELPEYGIGPDENDVFCPACGEDVPAVFVEQEDGKQMELFNGPTA